MSITAAEAHTLSLNFKTRAQKCGTSYAVAWRHMEDELRAIQNCIREAARDGEVSYTFATSQKSTMMTNMVAMLISGGFSVIDVADTRDAASTYQITVAW